MQLGKLEWALLFLGILLVIAKDILNEKGFSFRTWILKQDWPVRAVIYTGLVGAIVILGVYGAAYDSSGFLYTQF